MTAWASAPIGSVCELINGRAFKPSDWSDDGVPIVRIQNLNDPDKPFNFFAGPVRDRFLVDSGDILLSWSGTPGTSFGCFVWDRGKAILNQHIFRVNVDASRVDRDFFVHAVNSKLEEMIALAHGGVGLRHITKGKLESIELPLPNLAEQRRIVGIVGRCMDRIEELRRLRASAVSEARVIESAMFHDFVMDEAEKNNWPTVSLGEICLSSKYGTSAKASPDAVGCPVLRMGNIVDGHLDFSDLKYVLLPEAERAKYLLQRGDILINRTNSLELVGKAATFNHDEGEWIYASYLVRIRVASSRAVPEYVTAVINSRIGREFVLRTARRAIGMVNINAKEMEKFPIPLPPVSIQTAFVERLAEVRVAAEEIRSCLAGKDPELLRAAVLRRAFAGEL